MSTPITAGRSAPTRSRRSASSERGQGQRPNAARLGPSISITVAGIAATSRGNSRWQPSNQASDSGAIQRGCASTVAASAATSAAPIHRIRRRRGAGTAAAAAAVKA